RRRGARNSPGARPAACRPPRCRARGLRMVVVETCSSPSLDLISPVSRRGCGSGCGPLPAAGPVSIIRVSGLVIARPAGLPVFFVRRNADLLARLAAADHLHLDQVALPEVFELPFAPARAHDPGLRDQERPVRELLALPERQRQSGGRPPDVFDTPREHPGNGGLATRPTVKDPN